MTDNQLEYVIKTINIPEISNIYQKYSELCYIHSMQTNMVSKLIDTDEQIAEKIHEIRQDLENITSKMAFEGLMFEDSKKNKS